MIRQISGVYLLAGVAIAGAAAYVYLRGAKSVGQDIGSAAVDIVDGVVTGGMTAISQGIEQSWGVDIPTPAETIKDEAGCGAYLSKNGHWLAMGHCSLPAYVRALWD